MKSKQITIQRGSLTKGINLSEADIEYMFEHGDYLYNDGREIITLNVRNMLPEDRKHPKFKRLVETALILDSQLQVVGVERRRRSRVQEMLHQ